MQTDWISKETLNFLHFLCIVVDSLNSLKWAPVINWFADQLQTTIAMSGDFEAKLPLPQSVEGKLPFWFGVRVEEVEELFATFTIEKHLTSPVKCFPYTKVYISSSTSSTLSLKSSSKTCGLSIKNLWFMKKSHRFTTPKWQVNSSALRWVNRPFALSKQAIYSQRMTQTLPVNEAFTACFLDLCLQ